MKTRHILSALAIVLTLGACDSSDCPLTNTVSQKCVFYDGEGQELTVTDTLTVTIRDSVVLNRLTDGTSIQLPMSYSSDADTLVFHFKPAGTDSATTDTIIVSKTNTPHFVSLDCTRSMFHTITDVSWSASRVPDSTYTFAIDSVIINNNEVNYDENENLQIYFAVYQ